MCLALLSVSGLALVYIILHIHTLSYYTVQITFIFIHSIEIALHHSNSKRQKGLITVNFDTRTRK